MRNAAVTGLIIILLFSIVGYGLVGLAVGQESPDNTTANNTTVNNTTTETPTPNETETGQNQTRTGNNTSNTTNTTNTTNENNTTQQTTKDYDFTGNRQSSDGAYSQDMYVNISHNPNASTDNANGEVIAGSNSGDVILVSESYPAQGGAELDIYSERNVTVSITWTTQDGRGESTNIDLNKGLNVITVNADGSEGSITVPVPERPTDEVLRLNRGISLDNIFGNLTWRHLLFTSLVIIVWNAFILYWLNEWFRRNVLNAWHKLSESNLLKLFKH